MAIRLLPKHPLYQKVEKVFQLMSDLDISIEFGSCSTTVTDTRSGFQAYLQDNDNGTQIEEIPNMFEHRLIVVGDED